MVISLGGNHQQKTIWNLRPASGFSQATFPRLRPPFFETSNHDSPPHAVGVSHHGNAETWSTSGRKRRTLRHGSSWEVCHRDDAIWGGSVPCDMGNEPLSETQCHDSTMTLLVEENAPMFVASEVRISQISTRLVNVGCILVPGQSGTTLLSWMIQVLLHRSFTASQSCSLVHELQIYLP